MDEETRGGNEASIVVAKHTTITIRAHKPTIRLVMSSLPWSRITWQFGSAELLGKIRRPERRV